MAAPNAEISNTEEAIHEERIFRASRQRVYEALTVEKQFDRIIRLSGVMKADVMAKMRKPTKLSPREGSAFTLFGGYIVGRQIELVPTRLVVDHRALPKGKAEGLASGWEEHFWRPLARVLAQAAAGEALAGR